MPFSILPGAKDCTKPSSIDDDPRTLARQIDAILAAAIPDDPDCGELESFPVVTDYVWQNEALARHQSAARDAFIACQREAEKGFLAMQQAELEAFTRDQRREREALDRLQRESGPQVVRAVYLRLGGRA